MPAALRQSALFAAEDWRVIYRAFTEVNFSAYDFDTIRSAMVDYIRRNFPEDFNDWIESSEFVAIIELLAYLGQSLAFRTDLNTRENFLDTAERRESILKLARMLSYTPTRNQAGQGLVKITQISTRQSIVDSNGTNLSNVTVQWNDPNNPDWFEQFILILNSAFNNSNPFGRPLKEATVNSIKTQLYKVDNVSNGNNTYKFSAPINNTQYNFEVINVDINSSNSFEEKAPDPTDSFNIVYRNDGQGNSSTNTGFFLYFKQGTLAKQDFQIDTPIENRVIDINSTNINNSDVWVQEINEAGFVIDTWTKVPAVVGNNVIFNSINSDIRNIYSVITREDDEISLRFADGRFGNAPVGFFRVWYRQSANTRYQIRTDDITNISVTLPYFTGNNNEQFNLNINASLQSSINNSSPSESNDRIKEVAPLVYYTQDRMVNGEDYNIFPLSNPEAARIKSVNRIHSGFSRFIDINDPTGKAQNVNLFGEDGAIYINEDLELSELSLPTTLNETQITTTIVQPFARELERRHFFYYNFPRFDYNGTPISGLPVASYSDLAWVQSTSFVNSSTGVLTHGGLDVGNAVPIGDAVGGGLVPPLEFLINEGALIKFTNAGWVSVISIIGDGDQILSNGSGPVTLSEPVETGDIVETIIPPFRTTFTQAEINLIAGQMSLKSNFGLRYDINLDLWLIITADNLNITDPFDYSTAGTVNGLNEDSSWMIRFEYSQDAWRFYARTSEFIFESEEDIRFYFGEDNRIIDISTGQVVVDYIKILKVNSKYSVLTTGLSDVNAEIEFEDNSIPLSNDVLMTFSSVFREDDGFVDTKRIKLTFADGDEDGVPDDPTTFEFITSLTNDNIYLTLPDVVLDPTELFFEVTQDSEGYDERIISDSIVVALNTEPTPFNLTNVYAVIDAVKTDTAPNTFNDGDVVYIRDTGLFYQYDSVANDLVLVSGVYEYRRGRKDLYFQWKHYAPPENRIDPAITNIIDNYVLTVTYDTLIRQWIDNDGEEIDMPELPTTEDLKILFNDIEDNKMISDEIIWHPVKYKVLFGSQAPEELRASFKVTKVPGTAVSDGEIKARIISAINEFFAINNWDFGETFYFTELAAFVHQRLATIIGSIVLVPLNEESKFGNLFQVRSEPDEVFISAAKVSDIQIVNSFNDNLLRVGN